MRDYVLFHGKRHPREMGVPEVRAFLADGRFSGPAAGQWVEATAAIRFLYEVVLQRRWPRGVLDAPGKGSGAGTGDQPPAVYLNGRQPGVKLLDRVRNALRVGQYALETEKTYVAWIKKYILFHGVRHPEEMGAVEVEQFLTHLAAKRGVAKDTQRQALNALVFLYRTVLGRELGKIMPVRGRHGQRLPVVLTRKEVPRVLQLVEGGCGVHKLMAELLYGSGVRIKECCRLRVKDVDLERLQLAVRSGNPQGLCLNPSSSRVSQGNRRMPSNLPGWGQPMSRRTGAKSSRSGGRRGIGAPSRSARRVSPAEQ
jgi:hypothetical protein